MINTVSGRPCASHDRDVCSWIGSSGFNRWFEEHSATSAFRSSVSSVTSNPTATVRRAPTVTSSTPPTS
jgi:hypothetical protein